MEPVCRPFNRVVKAMVGLCRVRYWTTPDNLITDLPGLLAYYRAYHGRIPIWEGGSEKTVFGSAPINWAFRAWHDYCHIGLRQPFTPMGEWRVARYQTAQIAKLPWLSAIERKVCCALLDIEVNGQIEHYQTHGVFPDDQREFAIDRLASLGIRV